MHDMGQMCLLNPEATARYALAGRESQSLNEEFSQYQDNTDSLFSFQLFLHYIYILEILYLCV